MTSPATSLPSDGALETRLILLLRRVAARVIDGLVLSVPLMAGLLAAWILLSLVVVTVMGTVGGVDGLFAGSVVGVVGSVIIALVLLGSVAAIPAVYLVWAGRRRGPNAHQTIGHQAMGLRVLRTDGQEVSGRTLLLRELAFLACYLGFELAAVVVAAKLHVASLITLMMLAGLGALAWLAVTGRAFPHERLSRTRIVAAS